jgi:predicted O-linked N-acetylglucosamine transferase (SPINDLY family)
LIARDRIDILVDLSEHTHGGRLTVFAGRAAVLRE